MPHPAVFRVRVLTFPLGLALATLAVPSFHRINPSKGKLTVIWTKTLIIASLLVFVSVGCKKKQEGSPSGPKPQETVARTPPPSPAAPSVPSPETSSPEKPSEQQERALRRYRENVWFVHEAMQMGKWDESLTAEIAKLVKAATPDWDHANPSHWEIRGTEIAARLRPWLEMADKSEPAKRAAALLVADRIVRMEEEDDNLEPPESERPSGEGQTSAKRPKSTAQLELEKLGARFAYEPGSERYFYELNWLQQAHELDPKGRAGDLAFLLLMEKGFNTSPGCEKGQDLFREVINRGADFLREKHGPDIEARVHFLVADAYRDIAALAAGQHGDTYADAAKYKPEEADARTKATAEYRAGLALDDKSDASLVAKEHLRSLEAGEAPHDTRFFCEQLD